jgi:hypothetical protein
MDLQNSLAAYSFILANLPEMQQNNLKLELFAGP